MKRLVQSLRVLWRAESLLGRQRVADMARSSWLMALGVLTGAFGIGMLNLAAYVAATPRWGPSASAVVVAFVDLAAAVALGLAARWQARGGDAMELIEVRDLALSNLESEVADLEHRFLDKRKSVEQMLRHPLDSLAPGVLAALLKSTLDHLRAGKESTS